MTDHCCNPTTALTDTEVHAKLAPGQPGDDLVLRIIGALRADGATVEVEEADDLGEQALVVAEVEGRRMRITAEPW